MNRFFYTFLALLLSGSSLGQTTVNELDSLSKQRIIGLSSLTGVGWGLGIFGLSQVWYQEFDKSPFHLFDDCSDWLQMDKAGHVYSNYHLSEAMFNAYKWTGLPRKKAAVVGTLLGFGFQSSLELLDGNNSAWGFSWCDMGANAIGAGLFLGQELLWKEQLIKLKFSYHPTQYAAYRPNTLGSTTAERFFKDYNGQTYWTSYSLGHIKGFAFWPKWLCMSLGYSADAKIVGDAEIFVQNGQTFQAQRQFLFSLDLDVDQFQIERKWLKTILRPINWIKIPFPAVLIQKGNVRFSPLYF